MAATQGTVNTPASGTNPIAVFVNASWTGGTADIQAIGLIDPDSLNKASVDSGGNVKVIPAASGSATRSSVASSTSSVQILAANASRKSAIVTNDSTANLFLSLGSTGSTTDYTIKIPAGSAYELPIPFTGTIYGIWDSANGNARVTELT